MNHGALDLCDLDLATALEIQVLFSSNINGHEPPAEPNPGMEVTFIDQSDAPTLHFLHSDTHVFLGHQYGIRSDLDRTGSMRVPPIIL